MRPRRLSEVAAAVGGRLVGEDVEVASATVDSRSAHGDALFFAIRGERDDGHSYLRDAFTRGARAAIVSRVEGELPGPVVVAPDTLDALAALAADERRRSRAKVIGITGSTGKTVTKDLTAAVLGSRFAVRASPGSFNTEIGLPLTILGASEETEVIVCEMGSRGVGHIAALCRIAQPHVGIVTNVGVAHLELFGSKEDIENAKAELVEALSEEGTAIISADDPVVRGFAARTTAEVVLFGSAEEADVRAEGVMLDENGYARFVLVAGGESEPVQLGIPGEHMVANALAASAAGLALGVSPSETASALKGAQVSSWRMEAFATDGGVRVVNDAYNANPASMAAALKAARWMARSGRMAAVLGAMAELGPASEEEHERVGELVSRLGVDRLITVGEGAAAIARSAVREGLDPGDVADYADPLDALADVRSWARSGDVVLFKGSRVVGLEKIAEAMR